MRIQTDSFDELLDWLKDRPHKWEKIVLVVLAFFTFNTIGFSILTFLFVWFLADRIRNRDPNRIWENPRDRS